MEFKGTKEKWRPEYCNRENCYDVCSEVFICSTRNASDESKANALLISKAPEMLEMLKELVALHEMMVGNEGTTTIKAKQLIKEATEIQ